MNKAKILEIGSYKGGSTRYFLRLFQGSKITCVDTWEGSIEHLGQSEPDFARFRANVAGFGDRVSVRRQKSSDFFARSTDQRFDLIYVDGSHEPLDVKTDLESSWHLLAAGGILVVDDYLWPRSSEVTDMPAQEINVFLASHRREIQILHLEYEVVLERLCRSSS